MHHIHNGPIPLFLGVWGPAPYFPFQQDMKSIMGLGISHEIPNKEILETSIPELPHNEGRNDSDFYMYDTNL